MHRVARGEPGYPVLLDGLSDPPRHLWVRGEIPEALAVAIVGARGADLSGKRFAFTLAAALGRAGVSVISGGARGIDRAAHEGAMSVGALTVAVLGTGVDVPYPTEHAPLFDAIVRSGAVVSELPPGTTPRRAFFPRRNRIIAALARACVVVQADERSGSLTTARAARALGRALLAVPWSPGAPLGRGTADLLREGARVATGPADVLHALGVPPAIQPSQGSSAPRPRPGLAGALLAALDHSGATLDDLAGATSAELPDVSSTLLTLELDGLVVRSDCGHYERNVRTG